MYVVLVILVGICLRRRWMLSSFLYKPRQRFQILIHDFCSWLGLSKNEEEMSVKLEDTPKDEEEGKEALPKPRRLTIKESILDQTKGRVLIFVILLNIVIAVSMNVKRKLQGVLKVSVLSVLASTLRLTSLSISCKSIYTARD